MANNAKKRLQQLETSKLKVFLDHMIRREDLLYNRSDKKPNEATPKTLTLSLQELLDAPNSRTRYLRKPDFQRATIAWSPLDCVLLLESVLTQQVVPSVIMWLSPENYQYVLDGGHRISVVLAWLRNNWGGNLGSEMYGDEKLEQDSRKAAREADALLIERGIGKFEEYEAAQHQYELLEKEGKDPDAELDTKKSKYAATYRNLLNIGFDIQWVRGDYTVAEKSFLRINKSGRRLSDWETALVENRQSSFTRLIVSASNTANATHCWPIKVNGTPTSQQVKKQVDQILEEITTLNNMLFQPSYQTPIKTLTQPLVATPYTQPEMKPYYLSELLTIVEGYRGTSSETEELMDRDNNLQPEEIVKNGLQYAKHAVESFSHITGSSPRSLSLVPVLYFYNSNGIFVRGLLYGFIYWLLQGSDEDIKNKKRLFSAHRAGFEQVLLANKENILRRIGRRIGSGPEVTTQTASYFDGLLKLLIQYKNEYISESFVTANVELIDKLKLPDKDKKEELELIEGDNRDFNDRQKASAVLRAYLDNPIRCGICNGILDPASDIQHDHITEWYKGGKTTADNQRLVHPFCNNQANREAITAIRQGTSHPTLPIFVETNPSSKPKQLSFLEDLDFENPIT